jgi:epoxyqueuosine reductase
MDSLSSVIKDEARNLGFELVGIAPATEADGFDHLREWLDQGMAGEMEYMHRHADGRRHPGSVLKNVKTVVMVGMNYHSHEKEKHLAERIDSGPKGRVAQYARGADYHTVIKRKLNELLSWIQKREPACGGRAVVDTAPILERDFARRAGLGWFGKNTMLIHPQLGSYFFLGALLLDLEVVPDPPFEKNHCGTCTACLDACPTDAFPRPGELDARLCISYLTIELRSPVPPELRSGVGDWVFGCDICQAVCPWNRKAPMGQNLDLGSRSELAALDAVEVLDLSAADFRARFRDTALWRAGWGGLRRNAAIVLGNTGGEESLPALRRAASDPDAMVSEAARWAMDRIRSRLRDATALPAGPDAPDLTAAPMTGKSANATTVMQSQSRFAEK